MQNLPTTLYNVASVVQLEQLAIQQHNIPAYTLMQRAGKAVFEVIKADYSRCKNILVVCGAGNNAGDGYVVARLLRLADYDISVVSLSDPEKLQNEARQAWLDWCEVGHNYHADTAYIKKAGVIVDALLGTGLQREVSGEWKQWIDAVNASGKPVVSVDIPSGLYADTGVIAGAAIKAQRTVSFIGLKQGLFTAQGRDVCGEILFDDLGVPAEIYEQVKPQARLLSHVDSALLPPRKASSHKGNFGHVLIAGGNRGMPGAVILAARAALRTGAGLVSIATHEQNLEAICTAVPEAMVHPLSDDIDAGLAQLPVEKFSHIAVGMGLGQNDWARRVLQQCLRMKRPLLIDADGLNCLRQENTEISVPFVITPHPGEAARLLSSQERQYTTADIQADRFQAVRDLYARIGGNAQHCVVLKGSGSLLFNGEETAVCALGGPAMAAPGMGDVLSGIIIALMAQGLAVDRAAEFGVCLHAATADRLGGERTRGLLASDIVEALVEFLS